MANVNETQEANRIGAQLRIAATAGLITASNVAAANTVAGLLAAVAAATPVAGTPETVREQTLRAIQAGDDLGLLTDALIAPLTTTAELIALTGIADSYKARAFYD